MISIFFRFPLSNKYQLEQKNERQEKIYTLSKSVRHSFLYCNEMTFQMILSAAACFLYVPVFLSCFFFLHDTWEKRAKQLAWEKNTRTVYLAERSSKISMLVHNINVTCISYSSVAILQPHMQPTLNYTSIWEELNAIWTAGLLAIFTFSSHLSKLFVNSHSLDRMLWRRKETICWSF